MHVNDGYNSVDEDGVMILTMINSNGGDLGGGGGADPDRHRNQAKVATVTRHSSAPG